MGTNTDLYGDDIPEIPFIMRGVVEDNLDPDKAGRCRVRILGVHSDNKEYVKTEELPWAIPAPSLGMNGGGLRNIGSCKVPDIGSHVYVLFESGDHNYPIIIASAPAIEDVTDYQSKEGKLKNNEYEYDKASQYDDDKNFSETEAYFETPNDDKSEEDDQVQDWLPQTRKNTFEEGGVFTDPPPGRKKEENQPLFPNDFFQEDIRIAFDGCANHDSPNYNGVEQIKPSNTISAIHSAQELDKWKERKWGFNDNEPSKQHGYKGDDKWKPTYPLCSTERNAQGEIIDTDILKERRTYIHPSKYFIEFVQLDADRQADDFKNEKSIKNVYERQRGKGNSPTDGPDGSEPKLISQPAIKRFPPGGEGLELPPSSPSYVDYPGSAQGSNQERPIYTEDRTYSGRKNNDIVYDDIDLKERTGTYLKRFEERKHNPGREKTVVEDLVYRYYMNKVNETYVSDINTRVYRGNDNEEIEHGDINTRLHRGSENIHIDDGNYNHTVNRGWHHTHVDHGHQFVEIYGKNPFVPSEDAEPNGNPNHRLNQHATIESQADASWSLGADKEGCDAKFAAWPFEGENDVGNQFFLLHKGHQIFRLELGHQHFQLNEGHQKFWLKKGHQTFHLMEGDQRFQLDLGNIERYVNGTRITLYTQKCKEITGAHWQFDAATYFKIKAPVISLDGDVRITGKLHVDGNLKCSIIDSPGGENLTVGAAVAMSPKAPSGTASVGNPNDGDTITPGQCS